MGRYPRRIPARLGEKLLQIRHALVLSQDGMLARLGLGDERFRSSISNYERGGEPELHILLQYARFVDVPVESLIDDDVNLPGRVQSAAKRGERALVARRGKLSR